MKISDYSVAYAQVKVHSESNRNVTLAFSSDDGIKAWLNSKLILNNHLPRAISRNKDHDYVDVDLVKGWNQINIKVDNSWGQWALAMRILDPDSKEPITDMKTNPNSGYTPVIKVEEPEEEEVAEESSSNDNSNTDEG